MNKLKFLKISVEKCYCLSANQAIIVYQKNSKNRIIIRGPGIFMLEPSEWYYFHWILVLFYFRSYYYYYIYLKGAQVFVAW